MNAVDIKDLHKWWQVFRTQPAPVVSIINSLGGEKASRVCKMDTSSFCIASCICLNSHSSRRIQDSSDKCFNKNPQVFFFFISAGVERIFWLIDLLMSSKLNDFEKYQMQPTLSIRVFLLCLILLDVKTNFYLRFFGCRFDKTSNLEMTARALGTFLPFYRPNTNPTGPITDEWWMKIKVAILVSTVY